ncbi:carboxymuconolactone decarboxylase family protein [Silvibacterium dinghuense]|uniref:Carboxymuconolactone decarboxylase n=1 Tax=Silvibacterium dinghuense TaxID=1560006 RepID=A0A4Q1S8V6_9BACT|nr:carboxymuconolactone decarboxylase family protein [Silvibacterium dinghuense]RXS93325.1 carboxymuconolactone decarboxylase [Silvibacterium dinghuense]GGH04914.1 carboxymuconolactone decarboxylase [Silvibacterium dinghuense]
MAHIALKEGLPGITGGFDFRPETAKPMRELAHILLHEPSTLTGGERELIATYVSSLNDCFFCQASHGAAAAAHLNSHLGEDGEQVVAEVKAAPDAAPVSAKLKALLVIAGKVQSDGKHVTPDDVAAARAEGATDLEIHDTVLIAAAFCMYNRYVDGLGTWQPRDPNAYREMGRHLAQKGYRTPSGE